MGVSGTRIGFLKLLSKEQSTYILQPRSVKSDTVTPSFHFIFLMY